MKAVDILLNEDLAIKVFWKKRVVLDEIEWNKEHKVWFVCWPARQLHLLRMGDMNNEEAETYLQNNRQDLFTNNPLTNE